jgi:hypothetical protein
MEIKIPGGLSRYIDILPFPALEGWDIQREFFDFAASTDTAFRRRYVLRVLQFAKVNIGDSVLPLSTDAVIDNHLGTWHNVELVFSAVLLANGIDPKTHADTPGYWEKVGGEMAVAFMARVGELIEPALKLANKLEK